MESVLVATLHHHRRSEAVAAMKKTKTKKKKMPIKVVYVSNPMKFNTSATEFRALVQQLTGQDSDPAKFVGPDFDGHHLTEGQPVPSDNIAGSRIDGDDDYVDNDQVFSFDSTNSAVSPPDLPPPPPPPPPVLFSEPFDEFEYDDTFMPPHQHQTCEIDNMSGFLFPGVDLISETS